MIDAAARLLDGDAFEDEVFESLDLRKADLGRKELSRCTFRSSKLAETRWAGARLEDCAFESCDLTRAVPDGMSLRGVRFSASKLMGIDWSRLGNYPDVSFCECNLEYASFVRMALRKTRFEHCVMTESTFASVDLAQSVFDACQLGGARFEDCELKGASFVRSTDLFVDPRTNRVQGLRIPRDAAVRLAEAFGMKVIE